MKKVLFLIFLSVPAVAFAQNDQILLKDFAKKVYGVATAIKLNEQIRIMQINSEDNVEMVAIDDKMNFLWRTTVKGHGIGSGLLKGRILLVVSGANTGTDEDDDNFTGYTLDGQTGKIIAQKVIYSYATKKGQISQPIFAADGSYFKLVISETGANKGRQMIVSTDKVFETKSVAVVNVNGKLDATVAKLNLPPGYLLSIADNAAGGVFLFMLQADETLSVFDYGDGKTDQGSSISTTLDLLPKSDLSELAFKSKSIGDQANPGIAYFSIIHKNPAKEMELTLCKINFNNKSVKVVQEIFTKVHRNDIEKAFVSPNKKLKNAHLEGYLWSLKMQGLEVIGDNLLTSIGGEFLNFNDTYQGSIIMNVYDKDLKQKFQQVFPSVGAEIPFKPDYHLRNEFLDVVSPDDGFAVTTLYGQLDMKTGKWLNLQHLEKKNLGMSNDVSRTNLWYNDNFILIYGTVTHSLRGKSDLSLQKNSY